MLIATEAPPSGDIMNCGNSVVAMPGAVAASVKVVFAGTLSENEPSLLVAVDSPVERTAIVAFRIATPAASVTNPVTVARSSGSTGVSGGTLVTSLSVQLASPTTSTTNQGTPAQILIVTYVDRALRS